MLGKQLCIPTESLCRPVAIQRQYNVARLFRPLVGTQPKLNAGSQLPHRLADRILNERRAVLADAVQGSKLPLRSQHQIFVIRIPALPKQTHAETSPRPVQFLDRDIPERLHGLRDHKGIRSRLDHRTTMLRLFGKHTALQLPLLVFLQ